MPRAAFALCVGIKAAEPPVAVVLTAWRSRIPARGCRRRPAATRTSPLSQSCIRCQVPSWRQRQTSCSTICHGGKSWGSRRQAQPPRTIEKVRSRARQGPVRTRCVHRWPREPTGGAASAQRGRDTSRPWHARSRACTPPAVCGRSAIVLLRAAQLSGAKPAPVRTAAWDPTLPASGSATLAWGRRSVWHAAPGSRARDHRGRANPALPR
jgi:hypothetical protein